MTTPVQYTATPKTFRAVSEKARAAGVPAEITCEPGLIYPQFVRSNVGAQTFAKFLAPVTFKCAGATFQGEQSVSGAENITVEGGVFLGRLIFANFKTVTVRGATFPQGFGVMGRNGVGLVVDDTLIVSSAAAISLIDVTQAWVRRNTVSDFSGNAGISAYGGGDVSITDNVLTGSRRVAEGVHPDGIQTANKQTGTVEISRNTVILPGQGIFCGGVPDFFVAEDNIIQVDFPNALTWKSRNPAKIGGNIVRKLPSALPHTPRIFNYGTREGLAAAVDLGGNVVLGKATVAK